MSTANYPFPVRTAIFQFGKIGAMVERIGPRKPFRVYFRERREKAGLTQEQVALRMDTTAGKISKLENGQQRWNDNWLARAAYAFDCDVRDLFIDPYRISSEQLLSSLPEDSRKIVIDLIDKLSNRVA